VPGDPRPHPDRDRAGPGRLPQAGRCPGGCRRGRPRRGHRPSAPGLAAPAGLHAAAHRDGHAVQRPDGPRLREP